MSEREQSLGKRPRRDDDEEVGDASGDEGAMPAAAAGVSSGAPDVGGPKEHEDAADEDFEEDEGGSDEDFEDVEEDEGDGLLRISSKQEWDDNKKSLQAHMKNPDLNLRARRFEVEKQYDANEFVNSSAVCTFYLDAEGLLMCEEEGCGRPHASKARATSSHHHCGLHISNYHEPARRMTTTGKVNAAAGKVQKELAFFFKARLKSSEGQL